MIGEIRQMFRRKCDWFFHFASIAFEGSGSCPECNVPLRRNNFRVQMFEDPMVEKEVDIRRRILRDYNKKVAFGCSMVIRCHLIIENRQTDLLLICFVFECCCCCLFNQEEDFATGSDYDNYLEEIECIIYNLCNNIDIINTNKRIEQYKRENREQINKNRQRIGRDERELEILLEYEQQEDEERRKERDALENDAKKKKLKEKEALIDELMFSHKDANSILKGYAENVEKLREEERSLPAVKKATEFSTGVKFGQQTQFLPLPKVEEGPLYSYEMPILPVDGPIAPDMIEIECRGYTKHVR